MSQRNAHDLAPLRDSVFQALLFAIVLWMCACSSGSGASHESSSRKIALAYGDSILFESRNVLASRYARTNWTGSRVRAWTGIAVCDLFAHLRADLQQLPHPNVILLEMQGNSYTPCMTDPATGRHYVPGTRRYYDKYKVDFDRFFAIASATGARVVYIDKLPMSTSSDVTLDRIARREAAKLQNISVTSVPRDSVTTSGAFTWTKACLPTESVAMGCVSATNQIQVRNKADGLHFCPVTTAIDWTRTWRCSVYSAGERRFGDALFSVTVRPPPPLTR